MARSDADRVWPGADLALVALHGDYIALPVTVVSWYYSTLLDEGSFYEASSASRQITGPAG